jgi:hypothetical protein
MKKYKVIKDFFKLSEQKNYFAGDTIELSKEDFERMFDCVEEIKEKAKK